MPDLPKLLAPVAAAALLAVGAASCGGDDDSDPAATPATDSAQRSPAPAEKRQQATTTPPDGGGDRAPGPGDEPKGSADFVPQPHDDSGGGSSQFRIEGGDNSVQEFGEEAEGGEFEEAATALHEFLDARAQGAWAVACERLANAVVESFQELAGQAKGVEATECAGILARLTNPAAKQELIEEAKRADVGSLRIEGDRGFVIYRGSGDVILAMPMTREGGDWKVAGLAGTPLN